MAKVALFGDSYIRRLYHSCEDQGELLLHGALNWYSLGGLRTDRMDMSLYEKLLAAEANIVFLNIGGNDISPSSTPRQIFSRICQIADDLAASGVRKVFIGEILTRGNFNKCPGLTRECFEGQRKKVNKLLAKKYQQHFIRFNDIKFPADYSRDMVHLNSVKEGNCGMKKYKYRIQRVLRAAR